MATVNDLDELATDLRDYIIKQAAALMPPPVSLTVYDTTMRMSGGWILCKSGDKIVRVLMPNNFNPGANDVVIALAPNPNSPSDYYVCIGAFSRDTTLGTQVSYVPPIVTPTVAAPGGVAAYTVSNVTTDRAYDADATSTAELADILGTLLADLKTRGIVG